MLPLLHRSLSVACPELVSQSVLDQLHKLFATNIARSFFLTDELLDLVKRFMTDGIGVIPFKGPVLAASVYGEVALREFGDLDFLVREQDVLRAKAVLASLGYDPVSDARGEAVNRQAQLTREDEVGSVIVELHWGFTPHYFPFPITLAHVWDRLEVLSVNSTTLPNISPEDLLLILCVHGAKHRWNRLQWICDIAELIRSHPQLNLDEVIRRARELGCQRMLGLALLLTHSLLDAVISERVLQEIVTDQVVCSLAAEVRTRLFRDDHDRPGFFDMALTEEGVSLNTILFALRVRERLRDRARYSLHLAHISITPSAKDWKLLPLPPTLHFLCYLVRPPRLVVEYGMSLVRQLQPFRRTLRD